MALNVLTAPQRRLTGLLVKLARIEFAHHLKQLIFSNMHQPALDPLMTPIS
ncbi:MAG: hypothetical protein GX822_02760 [Alcaligenaceae bacterium]|nr:hypothetical protein [Alcaligenaceae bacterium]